jgi:hypothetical protein
MTLFSRDQAAKKLLSSITVSMDTLQSEKRFLSHLDHHLKFRHFVLGWL